MFILLVLSVVFFFLHATLLLDFLHLCGQGEPVLGDFGQCFEYLSVELEKYGLFQLKIPVDAYLFQG